jgi:hypothetical protein
MPRGPSKLSDGASRPGRDSRYCRVLRRLRIAVGNEALACRSLGHFKAHLHYRCCALAMPGKVLAQATAIRAVAQRGLVC